MEARKVMFIINPGAWGLRKKYLKKILKFKQGLAKERGLEITTELTSQFGEKSAVNLAKETTKAGCRYLIAVGGDGTINEVANGIINSGVSSENAPVVGVVPAGLGNDFAIGLGIPKGVKWILEILQDQASIQSQIISVDLGKASWENGSRFFVNSFGIGLDAQITKLAVALKEKFQFLSPLPLSGQGMYVLAGLKELVSRLHLNYGQVRVEMEGESFSHRVLLLAVTNGPCFGRIFKIAPNAEFTDGKLDICFIKEMGRLKTLWNIRRVCQGTHVSLPEVETFLNGRLPTASSLTISSPENLLCQMDGEVLPLAREYRIFLLPKALKILVPEPWKF